MSALFYTLTCLCMLPPLMAINAENLTLILNMENTPGQLPRNFRTCRDNWKQTPVKAPSRMGLEQLNASGSGQFSENGLKEILKKLPSTMSIIVVDLREESHGFANGTAISWYAPRDAANAGKTLSAIDADEERRLQELLNQKEITLQRIIDKPQDVIGKSIAIPLVVQNISTEKKLAQDLRLGYMRIPVTDHLPPTPAQVDRFVQFARTLPPNTWLHFHCAAGEGRTTTFLALYDMLRNAEQVSFEDIVQRQHLIGGSDLSKPPLESSWKYPYAIQRRDFLKDFYQKLHN